MGSPDDAAAATKPPNPKASPPRPPPDAPSAYPDWLAASMHAYYTAGAPPPAAAFFPHAAAWGGQMMTAYGTPIPYSPVYYAHPSMSACTAYMNPEGEGIKLKKAASGKSGDGGRGTSGSGYDDATHSGESGSEGSSGTGGESANPQDSAAHRKLTSGTAFPEGETADAGAQYGYNGGRVSKLPVSAPGRAALPGPATNLNIGMDAWNASSGYVKVVPNAASTTPGVPGREGVMHEHQLFQMNEGELKREKRKQSNRESARRSRLRKQTSFIGDFGVLDTLYRQSDKQQECEDLTKKVAELSGENNALKVELDKLKRNVDELQGENFSIMGCLRTKHSGLLTEEELAFVNGHAVVSASEHVNSCAPSTTLSIGDDSR